MRREKVTTFQPRLRVLGAQQAWAIHNAALSILRDTGLLMEHEGARSMLLEAGCHTTMEGRVSIPEHLVVDALRSAPRRIVLWDQRGRPAMELTEGNSYYGTGSDTTFTVDIKTGQRRRATLADVKNFARLVDGLENLDFAMSMANPDDVDVKTIYVHAFAEMVRNTNKPLVFIADSGRDIAMIHRIAAAVAGGEQQLRARPFLLNYSEAISPLRFPVNVMERLIFCAEQGIPICLPSGSNAGGGAPVTLAGAMALGIAENLAGLVIHQLAGKGSPFLFGPNVSALDMRSSVVSYGCPEWSLTQAALADMRDEIYHLPIWAFSGASDSKVMDAQAGAEAMFSVITALLSRANLIHDAGYLEFGSTSCLEMVAMVNELVSMSRFFVGGIPVSEETLALETIDRVARGKPGSIFLTDDHTFENFETCLFLPKLLDRTRFEAWEAKGAQDLRTRCNAAVQGVLREHEVLPKSDEVLREIDAVLSGS